MSDQSWEDVDRMSEKAFKEGKYQNDFYGKSPGEWPIRVENYKGDYIGTWTHMKWRTEMIILLEKFQKVLDGQILPKWEDIPYRSEKDFRGGIFSNFVDNWIPIINQLPTEQEKVLTYKLIHEGLSFTDNQDEINISNARTFRNKTKLVTANETNKQYERIISLGGDTYTDKTGKSWFKTGDTVFPRKLHYPQEVVKDRNGVKKIIPYYQPNQAKILDNPNEIQAQIEKWVKQGVMNYVGRKSEVKSKMRTSLVLAYNENKDAYRICFDGGAGKATQAFTDPCNGDKINVKPRI